MCISVLIQVKTFHATTKSVTVRKEVARLTRPSIQPRQGDAWSGEELVIPPLPPSFLNGCKIIDIGYKLQVIQENFTLDSSVLKLL